MAKKSKPMFGRDAKEDMDMPKGKVAKKAKKMAKKLGKNPFAEAMK